MKLYHQPHTRSMRALWILEELGLGDACEIHTVDIFSGAGRAPEHRARHPHGYVPVFVDDDGTTIFESAAIVLHLADKYPERGLAPAPGTADRARYYQFAVYAPATIDPLLETIMFNTKFLPEGKRSPEAAARAAKRFATCATVIGDALEGRPFLLGEFSAADVIVGLTVGWARMCDVLEPYPALAAYGARLAERPAFQRATAR